ncbi:hypothetical protein LINPERPRIM_LOCUS43740, partial [Linum perenne]
PCNSSELRIVVKILCFRLSNKSLNTPFPKKLIHQRLRLDLLDLLLKYRY